MLTITIVTQQMETTLQIKLPVAQSKIMNEKMMAMITPWIAFKTKASSVAILGHSSEVYLRFPISSGDLLFQNSVKFYHWTQFASLFSPDYHRGTSVLAKICENMMSPFLMPKALFTMYWAPSLSLYSSPIHRYKYVINPLLELMGHVLSSSTVTYFLKSFIQHSMESKLRKSWFSRSLHSLIMKFYD